VNIRTTAIAFVFFSVFYTFFFSSHSSYAGAHLKIVPILILAWTAWTQAARDWRWPLTAALLLSALGDLLLDLDGLRGDLFIAGLGSFLLAQLCYAGLFWRHRSSDARRWWLVLAYLPVAGLLASQILPGVGDLVLPVGGYLLAISAMVTGAALTDRPLLLLAGAVSFAISDTVLAFDRFLHPVPAAGILIMGTYYLGQGLICAGALQATRRSTT
jgi:uncharacterized membrane protein YhhN